MKRLLAMLLAGCMLVQTLPGSAVSALGAETEGVTAFGIEGDFTAGGSAEDMTAVDVGIIEEVSPDDSAVVSNASGEDASTLNVGDGAANGGDTDSSFGDEIIDEIDIVSPVGAVASEDETDGLIGSEEERETESKENSDLEYAEISQDPGLAGDIVYDTASSYIEVRVAAGQSFVPDEGLVVEAGYSRPDGTDEHREQKVLEKLGDTAVFEFKVEPGKHRVIVDADRYACYEQEITTKASQRSKICVSTARSVKKNESDAGSGWLRLGDVGGDAGTDEDGKINDADINTICNVILGRNTSPADWNAANLNEGLEDVEKVDIADLQIAVQNRKEKEQISSVEVQQIPRPPKAEEGTTIKGNINDLISGSEENKKPVTLQPEAGEKITAENPVAISFPLAAEGEEAPQLEGMTLKAFAGAESTEESGGSGTDNGIQSGWLEVESTDEKGPVVYLVKMTDNTDMDKALETPPAEETEAETEPETKEGINQVLNEMNEKVAGIPEENGTEADTTLIESETQETSAESETNTEADTTLTEDEPDTEADTASVENGMDTEQTETAVGTDTEKTETDAETGTDIELGDPSGAAVSTVDEDPISINMEDVILGDVAEVVLDGMDSVTDPDALSVNLEDGVYGSVGMDGEAPGEADVIVIPDEMVPQADTTPVRREELKGSSASVANDGSIVMNFGKQVAVKKVTIKITGTKKEDNLINISKVEFVNDMASRIPEPELSIPTLTLTPGNEEILVTWNEEENVTGYELEITGIAKKQTTEQTEIVRVAGTAHTFTHIKNNDLKNFKPYKIRARSINGEWRSPWSEMKEATPKPDARPEPVDNLKIKAGYKSLSLSWKDMDDASGYMVFYREDSETGFRPVVEGSGSYQPADDTEAEVNKSGEGRITTNSYTLNNLEDGKLYWVYVIGWNELGWGSSREDRIVSERTESKARPQLPKYHAINLPETDDESSIGKLTPHIVSADCSEYDANPNNNSEEKDKGKQPRMVNSKIDGCVAEEGDTTPNKTKSALGVVDNDYDSYWQKYDWDEGYVYGGYGIHVKLDKAYRMSYLTYSAYNIESEFARGYVERAKIRYRNTTEDPNAAEQEVPVYVSRRYDVNGQLYYLIKFQEAVEANEIRMCLGKGSGDFWMRVGEIRFHECDKVYDGIMGLFADEMHSSLREDVTAEELAELEAELEMTDHDEKHPLYDSLQLELKLAKELFADREKDQTVLKVDTRLTTNSDGHLKFGGLNAWQPLGRVAAKGETMVIYVGHNTKRAEESSNLQAVFTQYHAQSNELNYTVNLKVGRNEIIVPSTTSENRERGGQVYIQYTGSRGSAEQYEVRALGGQKIPVLNIYKMKPGADKTAAIEKYVKELDEYVKTIRETHESLRPTENTPANEAWKKNSNLGLDYTDRNCFLNATDLMMDYMMYSVPALQVWSGITGGKDISYTLTAAEVTEAAKKLETSLNAMEDTMRLFYQHKGLTDDPEALAKVVDNKKVNEKNEMPVKHLNIRYMQMFAGAFMYASGNHIGVEYPETNVAGGAASWDSFGWGIGHEIGHDINQSWYAIAEITNNYFAQLLTKAYNGTRFKYEIAPGGEDDPANDIYSKVTSGALGRSANGAVQLGLYWQLHLAFDDYTINNKGMTNNTLNDTTSKVSSYPYKDDRYVFNDYDEQFENLFFARVDTYGRDPDKAPKGKVPLDSGTAAVDQNLMRLACAAADANILPFFERWGMVPDEVTLAYAKLYGEETTKALYYVNDDARDYRAAHPDEAGNILGQDAVETVEAKAEGSKVSITVTPKTSVNGEVLLGYEIIRTMYSNGKPEEAVVGFKLANGSNPVTYIDEIATINNRVMYYKVKAVDKYLNYSNAVEAEDGVKIETNGALPKSEWTIETTMKSNDDAVLNPSPSFDKAPAPYVDNGKDDPDGGFDSDLKRVQNNAKKVEHSIDKIADGSDSSVYTGTDGKNAIITIDMHDFCKVTSLIYRGDDLGTVTVSVSTDNTNWTDVKNIDMSQIKLNEDGSKTIWFDAASDDPEVKAAWIGTYKARYVNLAFSKAGVVQIKEIDICGPSGDNLEFEKADGEGLTTDQNVIGVLKGDYMYSKGEDKIEGTEDDGIIPDGSLIFTGRYKGNPAYNVVILYDAEGNVIGAHKTADGKDEVKSEQIIFAEVPENGNLGETSDGIWVYYLEPEIWKDEATWKPTVKENKIRGELYRVDNALTNEGERIVSDTKFITLPDTLPEITMTGGGLDAAPAGQETEAETQSGDAASTEKAAEGGHE